MCYYKNVYGPRQHLLTKFGPVFLKGMISLYNVYNVFALYTPMTTREPYKSVSV